MTTNQSDASSLPIQEQPDLSNVIPISSQSPSSVYMSQTGLKIRKEDTKCEIEIQNIAKAVKKVLRYIYITIQP